MNPIIEHLDALVLDLDGVLYRGNTSIPGSAHAVEALRQAGKRLLFVTNNSTRTEGDVVLKLSEHGVSASVDEVVTSAKVTTDLLLERDLGGQTVFLIGGHGIRSSLSDAGFKLMTGDDGADAQIVVVGGDRSFDYEAMRIAADAVRSGATFIATNSDPSFPTPTGLVPGPEQ